jgi:glyoxylase-like metal-dependent hydrolase (beta-lactamase superfamily II)
MQLAPSLHRLGKSSLVNSYLIHEAGQLTLVDAGLPGLWKDLLLELRTIGRSLNDIRAVLLTHGDVDHIGFAERLRREHRIPVWVSEADAAEARGEVPKPSVAAGPMRIVPMTQFMLYGALHGGLRSTPIREVRSFAVGEVVDVPGSPRVIGLPGHTPGSVAFSMRCVDAIFIGDAMTTRSVTTGKVGPALGPFTVNPAQALASLDSLAGLTPRWVLPGHGDAWDGGLAEAVRQIRAASSESADAPALLPTGAPLDDNGRATREHGWVTVAGQRIQAFP